MNKEEKDKKDKNISEFIETGSDIIGAVVDSSGDVLNVIADALSNIGDIS